MSKSVGLAIIELACHERDIYECPPWMSNYIKEGVTLKLDDTKNGKVISYFTCFEHSDEYNMLLALADRTGNLTKAIGIMKIETFDWGEENESSL